MARKTKGPARAKTVDRLPDHDPPDDMEAEIQVLRTTFQDMVQKRHPTWRENARTVPKRMWYGLIEWCRDHDVYPVEYVAGVVDLYLTSGGMILSPACLVTEEARRLYKTVVLPGLRDRTRELVEMEVANARRLLYGRTGTWTLTPQNLELLRAVWFQVPAYVRVLMAPQDPIVWDLYGYEAKWRLSIPVVRDRCREMGFPIDQIDLNRPASKPDYL